MTFWWDKNQNIISTITTSDGQISNPNLTVISNPWTAFNSSMCVTEYAECIYVLAEYLKY